VLYINGKLAAVANVIATSMPCLWIGIVLGHRGWPWDTPADVDR